MLSNFRSTFKNLNINGKLWNAAKVGNAAGFHEVMESIKEDSVDAYVWLKVEPVDKWARHCFDPRIKSDHVTNNMLECFNSWIKDKRDKPILTLLEHLRRKIMVRLCEKVDLVEKMVDSITPYARNKSVDNEKYARKLQVIHGMKWSPKYISKTWPRVQKKNDFHVVRHTFISFLCFSMTFLFISIHKFSHWPVIHITGCTGLDYGFYSRVSHFM
ncbi:hypothetical protein ACOSQ4_013283 [Xanthoceras sorbifolium]